MNNNETRLFDLYCDNIDNGSIRSYPYRPKSAVQIAKETPELFAQGFQDFKTALEISNSMSDEEVERLLNMCFF